MSNIADSLPKIEYFRQRWVRFQGVQTDSDILKCILENTAYCNARFKRIVMLNRNLNNDTSDNIASLVWESCGHNTSHLCSMWRWAEQLELFKQDSNMKSPYIETLWRKADSVSVGEPGSSYLEVFDDELTTPTGDPNLVSFLRALYTAYRASLEQAIGSDQTTITDLEQVDCSPEHPFELVTTTRQGPFEVGLEAFLSEQYLKEARVKLDKGWNILNLGRKFDFSFLSSSQRSLGGDSRIPLLSLSQILRRGQKDDIIKHNTIIFDVAGSGKTQKVFDIFCQSYGHYILATARWNGEAASRDHPESQLCDSAGKPQDVLTFQRSGASQDFKLLYKYNGLSQFYDNSVLNDGLSAASACLNFNRDVTLRGFLRRLYKQFKLKEDIRSGPQRWLLFQTICGSDEPSFDPFYSSLDILLLIKNREVALSSQDLFFPNCDPIICLDEAQVLLADTPSRITDLDLVLEGLCRRTGDLSRIITEFRIFPTCLVVVGTALRLHESVIVLDNLLKKKRDWQKTQYNMLGESLNFEELDQQETFQMVKFPLLVTNEDFECLLRSQIRRLINRILYLKQLDRIIVIKLGFAKVLLPNVTQISPDEIFDDGVNYIDSQPDKTADYAINSIENFFMTEDRYVELVTHSLPLRGRYRWSVIYIEHLVARYLHERANNLNSMSVDSSFNWILEQSEHCQSIVKGALRVRLEQLEQKPGPENTYMLEDLYWTAIRADLMHKPCILRDTTSGELITRGFAQLDSLSKGAGEAGGEKTVLKQALAEPLAVMSIIEHLRAGEQGGDRHKRMLERLLFDNQDDASSFGKSAEFYLAWSFGGLLQSDSGNLHLALHSRSRLIKVLNESRIITARGDPQGQAVNLADYSLYTAAPHAPRQHNLNESLDFHAWLQCIREGKFFPTFYFPSTLAGPDIVFMMKHNDLTVSKRILIAIQASDTLKTGESCRKPDTAKVLSTVDPNLWFSSKSSVKTRAAFREEIERHKWGTNLEIITLLFTTSVSVQKFFAFKAGQGPSVGQTILEETMQTLANEDQTSLSEEDGIRVVRTVHQKVTGKAWGRETKKNAGHSSVEEEFDPSSDPDAMSLGDRPEPTNERDLVEEEFDPSPDPDPMSLDDRPESTNERDVSIRRNYRFAVLERHHTTDFLGKSTDELITLIKDSKPPDLNLPEVVGVKLDQDERKTLRAKANKLTVKQLKTCLKDWVDRGLAKKRKADLVELVLDWARHLGPNEVLGRLEMTRKRAASGTVDTRDLKKARPG